MGKSITLTVCYSAEALDFDEITNQIDKMQNFTGSLKNNLSVSTPDNLLNKMTELYKNNGFLTRSGEKTYWDRSALYTIRGLFYSNEATRHLMY